MIINSVSLVVHISTQLCATHCYDGGGREDDLSRSTETGKVPRSLRIPAASTCRPLYTAPLRDEYPVD
jgi:hypothetical protein